MRTLSLCSPPFPQRCSNVPFCTSCTLPSHSCCLHCGVCFSPYMPGLCPSLTTALFQQNSPCSSFCPLFFPFPDPTRSRTLVLSLLELPTLLVLPGTAQAGTAMLVLPFLASPFFEQLFFSACRGVSLCLRMPCVLVLTPVLL